MESGVPPVGSSNCNSSSGLLISYPTSSTSTYTCHVCHSSPCQFKNAPMGPIAQLVFHGFIYDAEVEYADRRFHCEHPNPLLMRSCTKSYCESLPLRDVGVPGDRNCRCDQGVPSVMNDVSPPLVISMMMVWMVCVLIVIWMPPLVHPTWKLEIMSFHHVCIA